jgi:hypothetical protein
VTDVAATPEGPTFTVTTRDGRTLHGERHGNGSPVVVFESGMGASAVAHPHGRHVEAELSGHYVPFTEPDLVAAEIFRMLDARA